MNLNNKIGWCDATWNPITGCDHGCKYCYARKLAEGRLKGRFGYENGFKPTFHEDRLQEPYKRKTPTKIFVSSMGEFFGDNVDVAWTDAVLKVVDDNPQHTFQFLTKSPQNIPKHLWKLRTPFGKQPVLFPNMWVGVSVTCEDDMWRIDSLRESVLPLVFGGKLFVSFEPLLEEISDPDLSNIDWVIIGRETGNRKDKVVPQLDWITEISETASCKNIPVYMKHNLRPVYPDYSTLRQEFPEVAR